LYVDVYGGTLCGWKSGQQSSVRRVNERVTFVMPSADGGMVVGLRHGLAALPSLEGPDVDLQPTVGVEADWPTTSVNDAKCDHLGRLWFGTLERADRRPICGIYTWSPSGGLQRVVSGVTISNGIEWSPDGASMYYVDSWCQRLDVFDYDTVQGTLSGRRTIAHVAPEAGMPDGITVDADGRIYVALFGGGRIHRYEPSGRLESVIELPVRYPTSCAFGGVDLKTLFVTTHRHETGGSELDGAVLAAQLPTAGLPSRPYPGSHADLAAAAPCC
jgi:sugar lactone lactonase YvrE